MKSLKPVVTLQINLKIKIQMLDPNVDSKAISKWVPEEAMRKAPKDESAGAGIIFKDLSIRGGGAMSARSWLS